MANSLLCTKCGNWIHGRYAKTEESYCKVGSTLSSRCGHKVLMDLIEKLCNNVETVNGFCYLEDRLNFSGGFEEAVTAKVRIGW